MTPEDDEVAALRRIGQFHQPKPLDGQQPVDPGPYQPTMYGPYQPTMHDTVEYRGLKWAVANYSVSLGAGEISYEVTLETLVNRGLRTVTVSNMFMLRLVHHREG